MSGCYGSRAEEASGQGKDTRPGEDELFSSARDGGDRGQLLPSRWERDSAQRAWDSHVLHHRGDAAGPLRSSDVTKALALHPLLPPQDQDGDDGGLWSRNIASNMDSAANPRR